MATMTEVLDKLTEREKALFVAEKEAAARVRGAEAEVHAATESLLELKRHQEQELKVIQAQHEKRMRDTAYSCRQRVHQAQRESAMVQALADSAEKRQRRSEAHVANLEQKISDLQAMISKRQHEAAAELNTVERMMQGRYARVASQADSRVRSMAEHAKEVCTAANMSLEITAEELQDQMSRASIRAEGRVRFKELKNLAKAWDRYDLSRDAYNDLKGDLIDLWHVQTNSARPDAPSETLSRMVSPTNESAKSQFGRVGQSVFASMPCEALSEATDRIDVLRARETGVDALQ
jgi:hypothetical protein